MTMTMNIDDTDQVFYTHIDTFWQVIFMFDIIGTLIQYREGLHMVYNKQHPVFNQIMNSVLVHSLSN